MNDGSNGPLILRGLDDVVAAVPHLMGAEPEESIIIFPADHAGAPMSRTNLPRSTDELDAMIRGLTPVYSRYDTPVVLLAYTERRDLAEDACGAVAAAFAAHCPVIAAATVSGDRWVRMDSPDHGRVPETVRDRLAAESLYRRGSTPYPSLREHRASFATRPDALPSQALTAARQKTVATLNDRDQLAEERAWMRLTIGRHVASSSPMPDRDAARLLADIENLGLRDHAWAGIDRAEASRHAEFWKNLLTRAPEGGQAPAAALTAFSYWIAGDGLSARTALERVPQGQDYSLARLIGAALHSGLDPKSFPIPSELPTDVVSGRSEPTPGIEHQRREPPSSSPTDRTPGVSR